MFDYNKAYETSLLFRRSAISPKPDLSDVSQWKAGALNDTVKEWGAFFKITLFYY